MRLDAASRIRCIQKVAHFSFHTCFGGKAGKIRNTGSGQKIQTERNKAKTVQAKYLSSEERNSIIKVFPYQTVCFGRLTTLPSFAAGQKVVSQTPRRWRLVMWLRCCCRLFRLVELAAKYTPPPGLCILNAETHPHWLQTRKFHPPFAFLLAVPTPY